MILGEARKVGRSDPYQGEGRAKVALVLVDLLTVTRSIKSDLRGRVLTVVANCRRLAADLPATGRALAEARRHLADGTGDPGLEAALLSIESSYRTDIGELEKGLELARRAVEIFHRLEDRAGEAHNLVKEASFLAVADRPSEALEKVALALERIPPRAIRLQILARLIEVDCLVSVGRVDAARHRFTEGLPLFEEVSDLGTRLQSAYYEARLLGALGHERESEKLFRRTVRACFDQELYMEGFVNLMALLGSLCRRGALRKAVELCEEAITAISQSGDACNAQVLQTWEELLAVVRLRQPTDDELARARNYLLTNWHVPKGGAFALPRLEAAIERAAATPEPPPPPPLPTTEGKNTFRNAREGYDRALYADALRKAGGNISEASRILGVSRPTVRKWKRIFGL